MKMTTQTTDHHTSHHSALLELFPNHNGTGLSLWRALRRIESKASQYATDLCNVPVSEDEQDEREGAIVGEVAKLNGGELPKGFFFNLDPRGYALKIRTAQANDGPGLEVAELPKGLHTDWGGDGILAAEID